MMQQWLKEAVKDLTPEQDDLFRELYLATFDATPAQLRSLITEATGSDLPPVAIEALARVCRIDINDLAYLRQ